jgi:uncharacterized protein YoxC
MDLAIVASSTPSMVLHYAAAFFFVAVAIGLVYTLARTGKALGRVDKLLADVDREVVPLIGKAGVTMDEVNSELQKVGEITQAVVDLTEKVDSAAKAVESAISAPARKAASFGAGVTQAFSSFFNRGEGRRSDAAGGWTQTGWDDTTAPNATAEAEQDAGGEGASS